MEHAAALWDWLNRNQGASSLALTAALIGVTAWYALQARLQAKGSTAAVEEMRKDREARARAHVTVELWPWDRAMRMFDIAIRNYGSGAAHNIRIVFDQRIPYANSPSYFLNDLEALSNLPFLGPHDEYLFFLGTRENISASGGASPVRSLWEGAVYFSDDVGDHESRFRINVQQLEVTAMSLLPGTPPAQPPLRRGFPVYPRNAPSDPPRPARLG